ncbi:MAG: TAT-variant-translocated molybdopterin oxidoreductase [Phycisphaerales bacterium]|nr:TAT-variant-translocated molybdopterin oxidoreductase [Phycisphaerales bacterium]
MGHQDRCPSKRKSTPEARRALSRVGGTGAPAWRSLDEVADSADFRDFVEREFPAGASELLDGSRREFIKVMGAGMALAGAMTIPGCRRPDHKILSYAKNVPEDIVPGRPLFYATSMPLPGGGAEGLVIETHEGRPTKVEGNPKHPNNRGKSSLFAQAMILGMYDPDRTKHPVFHQPGADPKIATWDDFIIWWGQERLSESLDESKGAGLAILADKIASPTRDFLRDRLRQRWPQMMWLAFDAADNEAAREATIKALGAPHHEVLSLAHASTIVSFDRDFLNSSCHHEPGAMTHVRDFASTRRPMHAGEPMSRLYVVESGFSLAGAQADHRLAAPPSRVTAALVMLARAVLARVGGNAELAAALSAVNVDGAGVDTTFIDVAAEDLVASRGAGAVLVGASQPEAAHLLGIALNKALGNVGATIHYVAMPVGSDEASSSATNIRALAAAIDAGSIHTLVCLNTNPVYAAPADLGFGEKFKRVRRTITLSVESTETGFESLWWLNGAHTLESWGDTRSIDGTVAPTQPMIAPLYEPALSSIEFAALLLGDAAYAGAMRAGQTQAMPTGYACVRDAWQKTGLIAGAFEKGWRSALHDGVVSGARMAPRTAADGAGAAAAAAGALANLTIPAAPSDRSLEVTFNTGMVSDGRFANNPWLQESPQFGTRATWDNPALMSPATAKTLGLMPQSYLVREPKARVANITLGGRSVEMAVWILPGMADHTIQLTLGYGRTQCGLVGENVGWNAGQIRRGLAHADQGASVTKTSRRHFVASTQNHWSLEGRTAIVRQIDRTYFDKYAAKPVEMKKDEIYGTFTSKLNLGEKLGELSHTPPNVSAYDNPYNAGPGDPDPAKKVKDRLGRDTAPEYSIGPQWGMSIDQSTCTGCGTCIVACQSENNIPTVGKKEVAKGREMHWIRVDRYMTGSDPFKPEEMLHQPVACVQCENAPCETVCPVTATVHDREGLNIMAYNRCIGTRYCSNNCPYKVRRFNFFDFGQVKFNGPIVGGEIFGPLAKRNPNLIPPRLRARVDEVSRMQKNPDVTIRGRGVMEKCNYCLQRINAARMETKVKDLKGVPDGFFQTACQQACPSGSIVFGDLLDEKSLVRAARENHRSYLLLGYLNTRPRTTHMLRVRNPNPKLRAPVDPLAGHHGGGHGDEHGHEPAPGGGQGAEHGVGHGFVDPRRRREDRGYAMSLPILDSGVRA